jgi:hypothetical protein
MKSEEIRKKFLLFLFSSLSLLHNVGCKNNSISEDIKNWCLLANALSAENLEQVINHLETEKKLFSAIIKVERAQRNMKVAAFRAVSEASINAQLKNYEKRIDKFAKYQEELFSKQLHLCFLSDKLRQIIFATDEIVKNRLEKAGKNNIDDFPEAKKDILKECLECVQKT